jgi:hypothetical protein
LNTPYCFFSAWRSTHTTICLTRDDSDTEPERLPCQSCGSLKQEPAVVLCDITECRASERGWRKSCGDRGIHRAGEKARRVGESSRGNWYVRVEGYADTVSPVKMREFRRNYLHHGSSKTFLFDLSAEPYRDRAIVPTLEWRCKGDFGHMPDSRK